jgi:dGTP triphosphohydrolase
MFENRFYTDEDCSFVDFDGERAATEIIPPDWLARLENLSRDGEKLRCIADYISGMTDDYADTMFEKAVHTAL